jgi:hypothetical protein
MIEPMVEDGDGKIVLKDGLSDLCWMRSGSAVHRHVEVLVGRCRSSQRPIIMQENCDATPGGTLPDRWFYLQAMCIIRAYTFVPRKISTLAKP